MGLAVTQRQSRLGNLAQGAALTACAAVDTTRRGEGVGAGPSLGLTPGFHDKPRIPSSRLGKALPPGRHLVPPVAP